MSHSSAELGHSDPLSATSGQPTIRQTLNLGNCHSVLQQVAVLVTVVYFYS